MMNLKFWLLLCSLCTLMFISQSCSDDDDGADCAVINCNTGTLDTNSCECDCPSGFTGTNCEIEEDCTTTGCENGATCVDGVCMCPEGYTGPNCDQLISSTLLGSYDVEELCQGDPFNEYYYVMTFRSSSQGANYFEIENIFNFESKGETIDDTRVTATITGDSSFEIGEQFLVGNATNYKVWGEGTFEGNVLTMIYSVRNTNYSPGSQNFEDECEPTLTKQ